MKSAKVTEKKAKIISSKKYKFTKIKKAENTKMAAKYKG